jgi:micrococcal nuclease
MSKTQRLLSSSFKGIKPYLSLLSVLVVGVIIGLCSSTFLKNLPKQIFLNQNYSVVSITDGDTLILEKNKEQIKARLLGINAPELKENVQYPYLNCYSKKSYQYLQNLLPVGTSVKIEYDSDTKDRYGRHLVYLFKEGQMINKTILQTGNARFSLDKLNVKYQAQLVDATNSAREQALGLWGTCGEVDYDYKCVFKGNIAEDGKKFYHVPKDRYYNKTVVNLDKEDHWLCTHKEAKNRGFVRTVDWWEKD